MARVATRAPRLLAFLLFWKRRQEAQSYATALARFEEHVEALEAQTEADILIPWQARQALASRRQRVRLAQYILIPTIIAGASFAAATSGHGVNPQCRFADGTVVDGTCMMVDEFTGSTLDTAKWLAEDDMISALLEHAAPFGCVAAANVSVSGGNLHLLFTSNSRASCPQTWTANAYYNAHFAASFPSPTATSFDGAIVDAKTFKMKYGHIAIRMQMPGGTGPTADVSLWGENCQGGGAGHQLMLGLFNNVAPCFWPQPGAREFDIPNFTHSNFDGRQVIASLHVDNVGGAPFLRNFSVGGVDIPYYGADWAPSNNPTPGYTAFLSSKDNGDPTAAFHVYETDWRPGQWSFYIDGVLFAQNNGAWVPAENMFPMFWNVDQASPSSVGLPVDMQIDYFRAWCPPTVPCVWSGA